MIHRASTFSLSLLLLAATAGIAAAATPLAPHRAAYELKLLSSRGKGVSTATGRIGIEFTGSSCDGYATNFRQLIEFADEEGKPHRSDVRMTTFEGGDGKLLRFNSEKRINSGNPQVTSGQAERADDGGLSIDVRQPKPSKMDVDGIAVFPTDHMLRLINAAKANERFMEVRIYDGSDGGEKIYDTTAIIGMQVPPDGRAVEEAADKAGLKSMARWPVSISYFEPGNGERRPVYVLSFDLYENGVSGALKLDFGDFAFGGELKRLEILQETPCAAK